MPTLRANAARAHLRAATSAIVCAFSVAAPARAQGLPPPPAPFENPVTAAKAVLGKILFWDEQLSSDNTMACGTCHQPRAGGADPRVARHPGPDRVIGTADDGLGSPGILASDARGDYTPSGLFGLHPQVTRRAAPTVIGAAYFSALRWDGRATETFVDPQTSQLRMMSGGALESHAAGPPAAADEMAYAGRTWNDIAAKLARATPLALATDLPPDLAQALAGGADYGELMRRAFGDRTIDATRVLYAIATYQRTLVPDRTPWDDYTGGNQAALTPDQQAGLALFVGAAGCARCHTPPLFADDAFHNLGLRPVAEDPGWQLATLDPIDRGKFKTPTLRNAGLRTRFMHHGQLASIADVVEMYDQGGGAFVDNKDARLLPLNLTPTQKAQLVDLVARGLTDPRVALEQAPFDRPTLAAERAAPPFGGAHPGLGSIAPRTLAQAPLAVGNGEFRIGIADAAGGAPAVIAFATARGPAGQQLGPIPIHLALAPPPLVEVVVLSGRGAGLGYGTLHLPIPPNPSLRGLPLFHQGLVVDSAALGGLAATQGAGGVVF